MAERPAPLFLLAGGRAMKAQKGPDPLLQTVFRRNNLHRPAVGYVGAASGDDPAFRLRVSSLLKDAGAGEVRLAPLCGKRGNIEKAKEVLENADIIFLSGGDVDEGMAVIDETRMTDFLQRLYRSGKPFFGISAGTILLARRWVHWRDPEDDGSAETFPCLGFAPLLCDTHGEDDEWEELKALLILSPNGTVGHGIVSGSAIAVESDGILSALGGEIHRFRKGAGGVVQIESLVPEKNLRY
jgi:cyanophycinase-like exopeptidase